MTSRRLYALAAMPTVQPGWVNFDGTATIYITDDAGLNRITLAFVNQLGDTAALAPGSAAAWGSLPAGQSAIYLFFEGLITYDQVKAIQVTPLGPVQWSTAVFQDDNSPAYLVLAPQGDVQVPNGQALAFRLTGVTASATAAGPVYVTFAGATGIEPDQATTQVYVNVQNQPVAGNQALDLVVGFAGSDLVFTGGQSNDLTLFLTNPNPTPLVPGGAGAWGPNPPTFQLSLVFGGGAGALTTTALATGISVNLSDAFGNAWKPVARQTQGQNPTWIMQPDPNGGGQVLGTGENASIAFSISGIQTQLDQGLTFAYLSYTNVSGYNDGFYALEILKVDPITVVSFTATPAAVTGATAPTAVSLAFEVRNASFVTITNTPYAAATTSDDFSGSTSATVHADTTFTLVATNYATGQVVAQPLAVTVSAPSFLAGSIAAGSLTVAGEATVQGGLDVSGAVTMSAGLTVTDAVSGAGADFSGTVAAAAVNVSGTVTVQAANAVQGSVTTLAPGQVVVNGASASLQIGEWTLTDLGGGQLQISCAGQQVALLASTAGTGVPVLTLGATNNHHQVLYNGAPIGIYSPNRQAYLNATSRPLGVTPNNWVAWSYWMQNPDYDSDLVIVLGDVG